MISLRQLAMPIQHRANLLFLGLVILLSSCARLPTTAIPPENTSPPKLVATSTVTPPITPVLIEKPTEEIGFYWLETDSGDVRIHPNSWKNISPNKIQNYTFSYPIELVTGKDGSNWYMGPFGIIRQKSDGDQVLFSNDPPNAYSFPDGNDFRLITIGPDGQVWVGGRNKTLFRFDGEKWVNEGENLPNAPGKPDWLCYNKQIVGIDFDQNESPWILTAEMEIYYLENGQWINLPERIPDEFMPVAGGGGCPQGLRVYSSNDIIVKRAGCCERPSIGIQFDGKTWKEIDDPKDIEMMFQWRDGFFVVEKADDGLNVILAIYEKDGTTNLVPFFSWLTPPQRTYVTETKDSKIYITNQNMLENEFLVAKFDKNTKIWKSFLLRNFHEEKLCAAHVDEEGYIWLQFNCSNYDSHGALLQLQDTLYRFSPDIFDDYQTH